MARTRTRALLASAILILAAAPAHAAEAAGATTPAPAPVPPLVPADFPVPTRVQTPAFTLVPLGPEVVRQDYEAYMSSIAYLQQTFTRSTAWPHPGITDADAMQDMLNEQGRFRSRRSFAYSVLSPDGRRERGSVYVQPSPVPGYDAVVRLWVTRADADAGFDAELYRWTAAWIAGAWPFRKVAWPGRAIDWATWDAQVAAARAK